MLYWDSNEQILTYDLTAATEGITKHRLNGRDLTILDVFTGDYASFANRANFRLIFIATDGTATGPITAHHAGHLPTSGTIGHNLVVDDTILLVSDEVPEELAASFGVTLK